MTLRPNHLLEVHLLETHLLEAQLLEIHLLEARHGLRSPWAARAEMLRTSEGKGHMEQGKWRGV